MSASSTPVSEALQRYVAERTRGEDPFLADLKRAAEAAGITPIVRPRSNAPADISAAMDRGAAGVQVPHVNTVEDAVIAGELKAKSGGALTLPEGTELENQADILRSVRKTSDALARPHKKKKKRR